MKPVAERLAKWLAPRGISWSGTAAELLVELGAVAKDPEELCLQLQANRQLTESLSIISSKASFSDRNISDPNI